MFGLMTKAEHERLMEAQRVKSREHFDCYNGILQHECNKRQATIDRLTAELARLRPIAEKAEARRAQALANLKQNRKGA